MIIIIKHKMETIPNDNALQECIDTLRSNEDAILKLIRSNQKELEKYKELLSLKSKTNKQMCTKKQCYLERDDRITVMNTYYMSVYYVVGQCACCNSFILNHEDEEACEYF